MTVHEERMTLEHACGGGWQKLYMKPDKFRHTTCNTRRHMTLNANMTCKRLTTAQYMIQSSDF